MQILQVKIRGTKKIQDSSWVALSQRLTVIQGNDDQQRKEFLTGLETINPLFLYFILLITISLMSAFVANTPTTLIFIPIIEALINTVKFK